MRTRLLLGVLVTMSVAGCGDGVFDPSSSGVLR